jgi:hypothetical protein
MSEPREALAPRPRLLTFIAPRRSTLIFLTALQILSLVFFAIAFTRSPWNGFWYIGGDATGVITLFCWPLSLVARRK